MQKVISGLGRDSDPVISLQHGLQGNSSHQGAETTSPQMVPGDMCLGDTENLSKPRINGLAQNGHVLLIVTAKQRGHKSHLTSS